MCPGPDWGVASVPLQAVVPERLAEHPLLRSKVAVGQMEAMLLQSANSS